MYHVKIINPNNKTDFIITKMHSFHRKFKSIGMMKLKLMEEFGEQVTETLEFHVGYFSGKQCTKYWLMCQDDLDVMYRSAN